MVEEALKEDGRHAGVEHISDIRYQISYYGMIFDIANQPISLSLITVESYCFNVNENCLLLIDFIFLFKL